MLDSLRDVLYKVMDHVHPQSSEQSIDASTPEQTCNEIIEVINQTIGDVNDQLQQIYGANVIKGYVIQYINSSERILDFNSLDDLLRHLFDDLINPAYRIARSSDVSRRLCGFSVCSQVSRNLAEIHVSVEYEMEERQGDGPRYFDEGTRQCSFVQQKGEKTLKGKRRIIIKYAI